MLIILPGWMHDAKHWDTVSKLLYNQNIRHAVLDFPGFGTVTKSDAIVDFESLLDWTSNEIQRITADIDEPITLLGHSCGGRIALALAVDNNIYKQLILIGSPNLYRPTLTVRAIKLLSQVADPIKTLIPTKLRHKLRSDDCTQATETGMQALYQSVVVADQTTLTNQVTTKVQLLWGAQDTATPVRIAYELQTLLADSTLTVLPNLGHNLHHENPGLLAGKIKLFLQYE